MEDKEKIDAGFSAMVEKEQAILDQAVKEYFGKYWPDLSTEEGRNTPMTFTPFAVMRLARHFYYLKQKEQQPLSKEDEKMFEGFMHKLEVCDLLSNKEIRWAKSRLKSLRPLQQEQPEGGCSEKPNDLEKAMYDKATSECDLIWNEMEFQLCYDNLIEAFVAGAEWAMKRKEDKK